MVERPTNDVPSPPGGWGLPWPNVAEIEAVLSHAKWTLIGGLMTQLHAIHRGIETLRPTNDVDIVLHVETTRGIEYCWGSHVCRERSVAVRGRHPQGRGLPD